MTRIPTLKVRKFVVNENDMWSEDGSNSVAVVHCCVK